MLQQVLELIGLERSNKADAFLEDNPGLEQPVVLTIQRGWLNLIIPAQSLIISDVDLLSPMLLVVLWVRLTSDRRQMFTEVPWPESKTRFSLDVFFNQFRGQEASKDSGGGRIVAPRQQHILCTGCRSLDVVR